MINLDGRFYSAAFFLLRRPPRSPAAAAIRHVASLHARLLTSGPPPFHSPFPFNLLLSLYAHVGSLADARKLFDTMPVPPNLVSYNAVISAHSRDFEHAKWALLFFNRLAACGLRPNAVTFCSVMCAAGLVRSLGIGECIHCKIVKSGVVSQVRVQTALLGMYADSGQFENAESVFFNMDERDVIAWNSMIHFYKVWNRAGRVLELFDGTLRRGMLVTHSTLSIVLSACGKAEMHKTGKAVHGWIVTSGIGHDVPMLNSLLGMYASCGDVANAVNVFERMEAPDLVTWNSLIAAYSKVGDGKKAMAVFVRLKANPCHNGFGNDEYTYSALISAGATSMSTACHGEMLHAEVIKSGFQDSLHVGSTLINFYFIKSEQKSARDLFNYLPVKDVIVWTEMIVGHSASGEGELALKYFLAMLEEGHKMDDFSLSSVLSSLANLTLLIPGQMLHAQVIKTGYGRNLWVCGSMVDMYAKNGDMDGALSVFSTASVPDLKCFNCLIGGYGYQGHYQKAFSIFAEMLREGLQPDHVTYVSLLSTCSHHGLLKEGRFYWFCMLTDGLVPGIQHYTCMVSLLCRAGLLQDAEELIKRSPFASASAELWRILLSFCVVFGDSILGVKAAQHVLMQEPHDSVAHMLLLKLCASAGKWDIVAEIRKRVRELIIQKEPGLSWIVMNDMVHVFSADDGTHGNVNDCRNELFSLENHMERTEIDESELLDVVEVYMAI